MSYKCEILADSLSPQGNRLTTFKVTYPRIIHAEMCRHRMLSRNTASSRAIPFEKMVKDVKEDPFTPLAWQKDHKGMQGTEYITDLKIIDFKKGVWLHARNKAIQSAKELHYNLSRSKSMEDIQEIEGTSVTKQLCNRLLEPFVWTTELVSGTEWENFFSLRCPKYTFGELTNTPRIWRSRKDAIIDFPDWESRNDLFWLSINKSQAEIHIQKIAEMMWDAYNNSVPKTLKEGQWHIPYGDNIDTEKLADTVGYKQSDYDWYNKEEWYKLYIATARAARISYTTLGDSPKIDYETDIKLHDRLLESKHLSCFEHCARVMSDEEYQNFRKGYTTTSFRGETRGWCNNFQGFIPYRYLIESKND